MHEVKYSGREIGQDGKFKARLRTPDHLQELRFRVKNRVFPTDNHDSLQFFKSSLYKISSKNMNSKGYPLYTKIQDVVSETPKLQLNPENEIFDYVNKLHNMVFL